MIFTAARKKILKNAPYVTLMLLASCAITTVPQFFLNAFYDQITGAPLQFGIPWGFSLMSFSHSPEILAQHFIGNLLVLLVMGTLTELVIGSGGMALLSLVTFFSTAVFNLLRGTDTSHGASGIFWGYHTVVFFILVVFAEKYGLRKLFRERYFRMVVVLASLDFIGINVYEVLVMNKRFFENFGQTIHIFSLLVVVPFILVDREKITACASDFFEGKADGGIKKKGAVLALCLVCTVNLVATGHAAYRSFGMEEISCSFIPDLDGKDAAVSQNILVAFNQEMKIGSESNTAYSVNSVDEKISWKTEWLDGKTMNVIFSRQLVPGDTIRLLYVVAGKTGLRKTVEIEYRR